MKTPRNRKFELAQKIRFGKPFTVNSEQERKIVCTLACISKDIVTTRKNESGGYDVRFAK